MSQRNEPARADALATIGRLRLSAIVRTGDEALARDAMRAAVAGGFRMVEFTLTTPGALRLIEEFAERPGLIVGAGTVLTPAQARDAAAGGARFLVSPVCDPVVIAAAGALDCVAIPGAFTPTEMLAASRAGADIVKLFPAPSDVAGYVAAILGPLPDLRIFPTAGVGEENFVDVLAAGAFGVGFTRSLFDPDDLARRRFGRIEERAARMVRRLVDSGPRAG